MKNIIAIFLLICAVAAAAITLGHRYLEKKISDTKPIPTNLFLGEITSNSVSATLRWPNAEPWSFYVLAALPLDSTNWSWDRTSPDFAGYITVKDQTGEVVEQLSISSETSQGCNWLTHEHGLDAFIITRKLTNSFSALRAGQAYDMAVSFSERPSEFKSLWLFFLQSAEQKREEKSEQNLGGDSENRAEDGAVSEAPQG